MELAENRTVRFEYEILEAYDAGIQLLGFEVKSLLKKQGALAGSFVILRGGEAWLVNGRIPPYQSANTPREYDPDRPRKLLLHRAQLRELVGKASQRGLTLVPIRFYTKGPKIKLVFGLARRKKKYNQRETLRRRDLEREIGRTLRGR